IIMSGISGSGKSTWAEKLCHGLSSTGYNFSIVSADSYFMRDGVYQFDPKKLSDAHGACCYDFINQLALQTPLVVVDNTNTTAVEIAPYILIAQAYHYDVEIITVMCESEDDVKAAAARNSH